jgi:hypothetical protein
MVAHMFDNVNDLKILSLYYPENTALFCPISYDRGIF